MAEQGFKARGSGFVVGVAAAAAAVVVVCTTCCVKVEVAVVDSSSLILSPYGLCGRKATFILN